MEITILIDNNKEDLKYRTEHGLSILIEDSGYSILFDTGKTNAFIQNAVKLEKDLRNVDYVILSHGHYDHTGGLEAFLKLNRKAKVILKKEALQKKWSKSQTIERNIGIQTQIKGERFIFIDSPLELFKDFWILPNIDRPKNQEYTDTYLFVEHNNSIYPDTFTDELFAISIVDNELVVFTGCAHNGVENMLRTAIKHSHINRINHIVGGTHLNRASTNQLNDTINALEQFDIKNASFNHCTGIHNIPKINKQLAGNISYAYTGNVIRI
ncbi:MBL fold metallo-hydrolase [Saccharicrinis aurantiacus]|uniref:MBL fold metallo-hydrolase n=1 Tax=Saccharicrinis aurantiacus TaxID=1849719 RepID=UPI002490650E|nr:MBL fold metallo-hydrolase [Saccharicrinis aurantiacus]